MTRRGRMTTPGETVEKRDENWSTAMTRKKMLAMRRNCSRRLRGTKVMMVYLEVMTWFVQ